MKRFCAVIVAAGSSRRMGFNKLFADLGGECVLQKTIRSLASCPKITSLVVVTQANCIPTVKTLCEAIEKSCRVVVGGDSRQQSVFAGIAAADEDTDFFVIHDGARPFVTQEELDAVLTDAEQYGAAILAVPVKDTIQVGENGTLVDTPDRATLFAAHTPQVFAADIYREAMAKTDREFTDDCALVRNAGFSVHLTTGKYSNIKITTPEDLPRKEACMRIGHGYDVHRLVEGRALILGGVDIPYEKGLLGHSDADVLTHAIMDALCGALSLGDIGKLFPDTDQRYKGADSLKLLCAVMEHVRERGFSIENVDATVLAQAPKLAPYKDTMRENLAKAMDCSIDRVSVKATTEEHLGFTGSGDGMAAHAVVLLKEDIR